MVFTEDECYAELGLRQCVNLAELKRARNKLALKYHPDKENGSTVKMQRINEAYTILMQKFASTSIQNVFAKSKKDKQTNKQERVEERLNNFMQVLVESYNRCSHAKNDKVENQYKSLINTLDIFRETNSSMTFCNTSIAIQMCIQVKHILESTEHTVWTESFKQKRGVNLFVSLIETYLDMGDVYSLVYAFKTYMV